MPLLPVVRTMFSGKELDPKRAREKANWHFGSWGSVTIEIRVPRLDAFDPFLFGRMV